MENAASWLQRLQAVECRDATYPAGDGAVVFVSAQGSLIQSVDGREYIDLCAGFGALPLGHDSAPQRAAFAARAEAGFVPMVHGMGDVFPSRAKIELLETLVGNLPSYLTHAVLTLTGSQAVETAVKTALLRTRKSGFLVFEHGYHGVELGILPLTAREDFRLPFASWFAPNQIRRLPFGCDQQAIKKAIDSLQTTKGVGFAGICVEPIQGRAGVVMPPADWLTTVESLCHEADGLLILDEVFVGMGRTGALSFSTGVKADLICLGKALGGGMPLSACIGTKDAMLAWPESRGEAIHTGTFFGHPLSCEIGLRTLQTLLREDWFEQVRKNGAYWLEQLQSQFESHSQVVQVRGQGFMWGLEFSRPGMGAEMANRLRELGVIALPSGARGEVLSFTPAFNIPATTLTIAFERLTEALSVG